jgi:hypothetical protein
MIKASAMAPAAKALVAGQRDGRVRKARGEGRCCGQRDDESNHEHPANAYAPMRSDE